MTINEIRAVKALVAAAHEIARDDTRFLASYGDFERVMWHSDDDLRRWKLTRKQFRRCLVAAFEQVKGDGR